MRKFLSVRVLAMLALVVGSMSAAARADDATGPPKDKSLTAAEPSAAPETTSLSTATPAVKKLRFQFRFQPWKDVLDWFAREADLSLVMDAPPQGTFNYSDSREYTPAEAIDLLNSVLLTKGYTLIRRDRMLMLINLEDGIPANLVSTVPLTALDSKGEFELVSVLFNLDKLKPEEAELEIRKLLGPQGSVVALTKSRQVLVTETAGRLRAIRDMLKRIEGPEGAGSGGVQTFELKYARIEDVLPILRQLLDIPEDKTSSVDGSIRIAAEAGTGRLLVSGRPEKVSRVADALKALDVPTPGADAGRLVGTPQIEVYSVAGADPASVLSVMQTLLVGQPDVRLAVDPKTNSLIALARPAQQATIRATLAQLQREGQQVEVIHLTRIDPQTAVASISKLFGSADATKGGAPQVDADLVTRQLLIRGTQAQILQIRGLLEKMGENLSPSGDVAQGGRVRTIPMSSTAARSVLDKLEEIWPTMRANKIRVVSPLAAPSSDQGGKEPASISPELLERLRNLKRSQEPATPPTEERTMPPHGQKASPVVEQSARLLGGARLIYVAQETAAEKPAKPAAPAPIIVMPGPNGLIIASEDTEALDEFERLLDTLSEGSTNGREFSVFYLKYAKAPAIAETLGQVFGSGAVVAERPVPGRRGQRPGANTANANIGSMASSASAASGVLATGPILITPDERLNALLVRANQTDLDTIGNLLKVLDQKESPEEIAVAAKARLIPVKNSKAEEIAEIVKQVYADRMVQASSAGNPQQRMMAMMMMQRGGRQRGVPGGGAGAGDDVARISVGVDTRTNSLIVAAPDPLFDEVKQLVAELDSAAADQDHDVQVVTLHHTSTEAIEQALSVLGGDSVQVTRTTNPQQGQHGAYQPNRSYGNQNQQSYRRTQSGGQQRTGSNAYNRNYRSQQGGNQGNYQGGRRGGGNSGQGGQRGGR